MPANLTPQYKEVQEKYRKSVIPEERLELLKEMLRLIPKHKGTERLQAEIKRNISEEKEAIGKQTSKKKSVSYNVDSCGHQQVVVVGPPNGGKSLLLSKLTGADLKVADYPYTTRVPQPAMLKYENIQIQMVDMPPIAAEHTESWVPSIVRAGDAVLLVADLTDDNVLENLDAIFQILKKQNVYLSSSGTHPDADEFASVKRTLLLANKKDAAGSETVLEILAECYKDRFEIFPMSALTGEGMDVLKPKIYDLLNIIRVYAKPPGKKPDLESPFIISKGSTVLDLAHHIHHEIAENLKSAKIWGAKGYTDGQRIPSDYVLFDGGIVELEA